MAKKPKVEIDPQPCDLQGQPQPLVKMNIDLNNDDVVAIKVADIESKLMDFETQFAAEIEGLQKERKEINEKSDKIIHETAESLYLKDANILAKAIEKFEGQPASVKITIDSYACQRLRNSEEDEDKKIFVKIRIRMGKQQDHSVFEATRSFDVPEVYIKLMKRHSEIEEQIRQKENEISKARQGLAKMGTLERHCRAELAKYRLKQMGREDILAVLDKVALPGIPLALPKPKK